MRLEMDFSVHTKRIRVLYSVGMFCSARAFLLMQQNKLGPVILPLQRKGVNAFVIFPRAAFCDAVKMEKRGMYVRTVCLPRNNVELNILHMVAFNFLQFLLNRINAD